MSNHAIYRHYLQDILENAEKTLQFIEGMGEEDFLKDEKTKFAVVRALEVIGEASKSIPEDVRAKYPHIPWQDMARMRDKLIHHYFGVDFKTVWRTANEDVPALQKDIKDVFRQESQSGLSNG